MTDDLTRIHSLIPHREPFVWVDRIISYTKDTIVTEKKIPEDLELFKGHYPGNPIVPGVLLCEAIFQSGALLMGLTAESQKTSIGSNLPVLTRISNGKFKRSISPGDTVEIHVKQLEEVASAIFFKGNLKIHGKLAVQVEFCCTMVSASAQESKS